MSKARLSNLNKQLQETKKTDTKPEKKQRQERTSIEANVPRGERSSFLKLTITMPADMLAALKTVGMQRKAEGMKDCDTSALIREALTQWIDRQ